MPAHDLSAALDADALAALERLAGAGGPGAEPQVWAPVQPRDGTWEDAAVRALFTAGLGCASFALVTHGWMGRGPFGPVALFAAAAVLTGMSPSSILVAAPAARAIAILRARVAGVIVKDPAALEALAGVDAACIEESEAVASGEPRTDALTAVHGLTARGVRAVVLDGEKALAIRDLQLSGARVLLVGGRRDDPSGAAQADVALALAPGARPGAVAAPIVIAGGRLDDLPWLIDLGRALRAVLRQNCALGAVYNAALIPAAALGYVSPLTAALAMLAETLLELANAARLLYHPAQGRREAGGRSHP